jgi:hypothetical protein
VKEEYSLGKLFGQTWIYAGYLLIVSGVAISFFSITGLFLVLAGIFVVFSYKGTIVDFDKRRLKSYICLFGWFKAGKWYSVDHFSKFTIYTSGRRSRVRSRRNSPSTLRDRNIRLALVTKDGSGKIVVNRYDTFDTARREMNDLIKDLKLDPAVLRN